MIDHQTVPLAETGLFSPIFLDYLNEKPELKSFYGLPPKLATFGQQIQIKQSAYKPQTRQALCDALSKQYQGLQSKTAEMQIELLGQENTYTVVTGHQLNIFTGPLYFIYKIVTTINLAKALKKTYPEYNFVPVYWMASEDHDFEEIRSFSLFGETLQWEHPNPTGAVGELSLDGMDKLLGELKDCPQIFTDAYTHYGNLADATRFLVDRLFGEEGLLVLDANDANLKRLFKEVIKDDLYHQSASKLVEATNLKLHDLGYKTQVNPREINFFYLTKGVRERFVKEEGKFSAINTNLSWSPQEIDQLLEDHPEQFSPNVVLRPLYQELILPNLAYIGGPSELAYWLQLKDIFVHYKIPFPVLAPRNFALVVNKPNQKEFEKLALQTADLFLEDDLLRKNYVQQHAEHSISIEEEKRRLQEVFEQIAEKAKEVDKSLVGFVEAEGSKSSKSLDNIEKRLRKAEENRHETEIKQLLSLKAKLFPGGGPQERKDNVLNFYLNDPEFLRALLNHFNPVDFNYNILFYT